MPAFAVAALCLITLLGSSERPQAQGDAALDARVKAFITQFLRTTPTLDFPAGRWHRRPGPSHRSSSMR